MIRKELFFGMLGFFLLGCTENTAPDSPEPPPGKSNQDTAVQALADSFSEPEILWEEVISQDSKSVFEETMREAGLLDIQEEIPGILIDLKYSTTDNFIGIDVYGELDKAFLRPLAVEKLRKAQEDLKSRDQELSLLVFDGARPRRVQQIMWDSLDIPFKLNYLANPKVGSVHNYGLAVDLTIADGYGVPLDMGTPFDFFGPLAQPQLEAQMLKTGKLTETQIQNRELLRSVMRNAGFYGIKTEWWHFNAVASQKATREFGIIE